MTFSNTLQHPKTTIAGLLLALTVAGPILTGFDWNHPTTSSIVGLVIAVAIAVLGALLKDPGSNTGTVAAFLLMLLVPMCAAAQDSSAALPVPPITQLPVVANLQSLYGAGVSYSVNATPSVAGTALYARLIGDGGTYAFTAVDAVPNTLKPFTVNTNIGVGVGQKVATFGKIPVYMPTAAGISFNGSNTGWQWNGGVLVAIHIKDQYYLLPTVRFLKSSVSNGSGYQPIVGLLFGWGQ